MPRLAITIETANRRDTTTAVARGELDLALTDGLTAPGDPIHLADQIPVTATGLSESQVVVVLPYDHPLAGRSALPLTDLADARWIAADNVAPPLDEIRRHAGTGEFTPALHYMGQDVITLINLASAGHGLTLLPETALRLGTITTVPVTTPRLCHRVELIHTALPKHSPAATLAVLLS
jgi:DNA-binding transcriptional LysR family regulator